MATELGWGSGSFGSEGRVAELASTWFCGGEPRNTTRVMDYINNFVFSFRRRSPTDLCIPLSTSIKEFVFISNKHNGSQNSSIITLFTFGSVPAKPQSSLVTVANSDMPLQLTMFTMAAVIVETISQEALDNFWSQHEGEGRQYAMEGYVQNF